MFGLGSSSQLGIGIAIRLNDQFSGTANRVNQAMVNMRRNANSAVAGATRDYRNQSAAIAFGAAAASASMVQAAKAGAEFQHSINQVYIVGGKSLGKTRDQLTKFSTDFSKAFTSSPTEVAKAMFENVKAGVTTGLEEITKYQIAVATATDEALEGPGGVAQNLLAIMNSMDLPISKFKDIANAVTTAANSSMASVYDIGESMQYAAFTAHQFNVPLEETLSLIAKMSQANIRGSAAGTGINNMFLQMAKGLGPFQTKQQKAAWDMTGLDQKQIRNMAAQGNIFGIIKAVEEATKGMDPISKGGLIPKLFNMRGTKALLGMFDSQNGNKSLADFQKEIKEGVKGDTSMAQAKAMMNDLHSDFKFFQNALHRFRIAFSKAAEPALRVLMRFAGGVVNFISGVLDSPIGKVLAGIAVVATPLVGILFGFRAAALTATMALGAMSRMASVGGFRSLLGSGLGMIGMGRFGNNQVTRNAAGRFTVPAGNPSNIINPRTGMAYKGGQLLSAASLASMGIGSSGVRGAGLLSGVGSMVGRTIPILGGILLGIEALKMFGFKWEAAQKEKQNDPLINEYYRNLDQMYLGYSRSNSFYNKNNQSLYEKRQHNGANLNQVININVDGKSSMQQILNQKLEDDLNAGMDFQLAY
jgi:TP901 family phage tail tape measure protein